jgi:hypothetical protein
MYISVLFECFGVVLYRRQSAGHRNSRRTSKLCESREFFNSMLAGLKRRVGRAGGTNFFEDHHRLSKTLDFIVLVHLF